VVGRVARLGFNGIVRPVASHALRMTGLPEIYGTPKPPNFGIDLTKDVIILWVPGTSNHSIPASLLNLAQTRFSSVDIHLVNYMASWKFSESVPNGTGNLRAVLDYLRKHLRKGQKILLAGESQGAWVISNVLKEQQYYGMIDKAVLLGHPGVAEAHFPSDGKILELNNFDDVSTKDIEWNKKEEVARNVEKAMQLDISSLPFWLSFGVTHPEMLLWLGVLGVSKLPVVGGVIKPPHDYQKDMLLAILWLSS